MKVPVTSIFKFIHGNETHLDPTSSAKATIMLPQQLPLATKSNDCSIAWMASWEYFMRAGKVVRQEELAPLIFEHQKRNT